MVARNGHSASLSKYQQNVQNTNRPYQNTNLVGIMIIGILTVGILIPTRPELTQVIQACGRPLDVPIFDLPGQDCCAVGCEEHEEIGEKEGEGGHLEERK